MVIIITITVSLPPLGAILGSSLSSLSLNYVGRKFSIILAGVFFFLSFVLIGLASISSSVGMILAGRALSGLGVGLGVPSTAIYVAECSSAALRGKLSSLPAFLMAFGVLLGYVFGRLIFTCMTDGFIFIGPSGVRAMPLALFFLSSGSLLFLPEGVVIGFRNFCMGP